MVIENNHKFDATVLPAKLVNTALFLGHNQSGHNGFPENVCSNQKYLLLEGYAQGYFKILQRLFTMCKTLGREEKVHRTIL